MAGAGGTNLRAIEGDKRQQQIALGIKVIVDRAGGELGAFGDLLDAGCGEAIAPEEQSRSLQYALAAPRLLPFAQTCHGAPRR